jgi:hypothetical protein
MLIFINGRRNAPQYFRIQNGSAAEKQAYDICRSKRSFKQYGRRLYSLTIASAVSGVAAIAATKTAIAAAVERALRR